jgi:hypothetical protein
MGSLAQDLATAFQEWHEDRMNNLQALVYFMDIVLEASPEKRIHLKGNTEEAKGFRMGVAYAMTIFNPLPFTTTTGPVNEEAEIKDGDDDGDTPTFTVRKNKLSLIASSEQKDSDNSAKVHDHACNNCFSGQGPCTGDCAVSDENDHYAHNHFEHTVDENFDHFLAYSGLNVMPDYVQDLMRLAYEDGITSHPVDEVTQLLAKLDEGGAA